MNNIKTLISLFCALISTASFAIDTNRVTFQGNHLIILSSPENTKVMVFLHGGVTNPYFKEKKGKTELSFILEDNTNII